MPEIIATFQGKSSKFSQDILLGALSVTLTLQWNVRASAWFVTITDGTYLLSSRKLLGNWPLLRRNKALFPTFSGDIIATKTDLEAESSITYDNLNNGWTLYYYTDDEVTEWENTNGV